MPDARARAEQLVLNHIRRIAGREPTQDDAAHPDVAKLVDDIAAHAAEAVAMERTRLREIVEPGLYTPSGRAICACHNVNAVSSGLERACWACTVRAALAAGEGTT